MQFLKEKHFPFAKYRKAKSNQSVDKNGNMNSKHIFTIEIHTHSQIETRDKENEKKNIWNYYLLV